MTPCPLCGFQMGPLDASCLKCNGKGIAAAPPQQYPAPPAPQYQQQQPWTPPAQSPYGAPPTPQLQTPPRSGINPNVYVGAGMVVVGIAATAVSFLNAKPGGSYMITWGLIVFGAVRIFRGLNNS